MSAFPVPHPPVVWIASFPKSGNTWLRFLLAHLLFGPFDRSGDVQRRIPDIHRPLPEGGRPLFRGAQLYKTHWSFERCRAFGPKIAGAVCIVRDPRDVVASLLGYGKIEPGPPQLALVRDFVRFGGTLPRLREVGVPGWAEHVCGWLVDARRRIGLVSLRYEDLLADPVGQLARIAGCFGLEPRPEELAAAVRAASVERLRRLEGRERAGSDDRADFLADLARRHGPGFTFFPEARSGTFRERLTDEEIALVEQAFAPLMRQLGYEPLYAVAA